MAYALYNLTNNLSFFSYAIEEEKTILQIQQSSFQGIACRG